MEDEGIKTGTDIAGRGELDGGTDGSQSTDAGTDGTTDGQPGGDGAQLTGTDGTDGTAEDTFFDPKSIEDNPELMKAYKQMLSPWTKGMQGIKDGQNKIEAYDAMQTNPLAAMTQWAEQHGYSLAQKGAQPDGTDPTAEFKTWDDVTSHIKQETRAELMQELKPLFEQMGVMQKTSLEQQLDSVSPDWRTYEPVMMDNLKKHPTLANDPATLYKISVPPELLESRAMKAALEKLENKGKSSMVAGVSTTTQKPSAVDPNARPGLDESVKIAIAQLEREGMKAPPGL